MATSILATVVALSSHLSLTDATGTSANREVKLYCKKHLRKARTGFCVVV